MNSNLLPRVRSTPPPPPPSSLETARFTLGVATSRERDAIARLRHEVYARELGQHAVNPAERLRDALDKWNVVLVAKIDREIAGFISLTPPGKPSYSIDKYFARETLPFAVDAELYEVRLLTVVKPYRGRILKFSGPLKLFLAFGGLEFGISCG